MRRRRQPPDAITSLRRWRDRNRQDRILAAERQATEQAKAEQDRKRTLRRERAAERRVEHEAAAIRDAGLHLEQNEAVVLGQKADADNRRLVRARSIGLLCGGIFVIASIAGAITYFHHNPLSKSEAGLFAFCAIIMMMIGFFLIVEWFSSPFSAWLRRKTDSANAVRALDRIARQRQALEDGAFTVEKRRSTFGPDYYAVRYNHTGSN